MSSKGLTVCSLALLAVLTHGRHLRPDNNRPNPTRHHQDRCSLEPDQGPCKDSLERYFFNSTSGQCETFVYGGCQGNRNRFTSRKRCSARCEDQCMQEAETGPCRAMMRMWFFNSESGKCEMFVYGGCAGNTNRFETEDACIARCQGGGTPKPACSPARCRMACPGGLLKDENGCEICQCDRPEGTGGSNLLQARQTTEERRVRGGRTRCRQVMCNIPCLFGHALDHNGCETCVCFPPPRTFRDAAVGSEEAAMELKTIPDVTTRQKRIPDRKLCRREPMCFAPCQFGYARNRHGCKTCKCLPRPRRLPMEDATLLDVMLDDLEEENYEEADIAEQPVPQKKKCRREVMCLVACPFGQALDYNGCKTCICLPDPRTQELDEEKEEEYETAENRVPSRRPCRREVMCLVACPFGQVLDSNGCKTCICLPDPTTQELEADLAEKTPPCQHEVMCLVACPFGQALDSNGCKTCICLPDPRTQELEADLAEKTPPCQREVMCLVACPFGQALDSNGCKTCICLPDPKTQESDLTENSEEEKEEEYETSENGVPSRRPCRREVMCLVACPFGHVLDHNGCKTCECLPDPRYRADAEEETFEEEQRCPLLVCQMFCHNGFSKDENGCDVCQCVDHPRIPREPRSHSRLLTHFRDRLLALRDGQECGMFICFRHCENGFKSNADGCPLCECEGEHREWPTNLDQTDEGVPAGSVECHLIKCPTTCPNGYLTDQFDCPTCECQLQTIDLNDASDFMVNNMEESPDFFLRQNQRLHSEGSEGDRHRRVSRTHVGVVHQSRAPHVPFFPARCPRYQCFRYCRFGFKLDYRGCPTCKCKTVPGFPKLS